MKNKNIVMTLLSFAFVLIFCNACTTRSTGSTEIGVRAQKWWNKGIEQKVYPPGSMYFFLPFNTDWYTFDTKLQNMEMTFNTKTGDRKVRDDLVFKTTDGNDIGLDVIIVWRVIPEKGPYILGHVATDMELLREKAVRTITRSKPRDFFGELRTEQFYKAENRDEKAGKAKDGLNKILNPMGVMVEKVLTKDYRFSPDYQKAIEDKKIADQQVEKNKSTQHAIKEEYKTKLENAKGEVNKMVADADGDYSKAEIEADAYYQQQEKVAKAILNEGIAEAKGITKMNNALAGIGGENMVKLQIAEALQGKKITVLPMEGGMNLKTTNMNDLINTVGTKALASDASTDKKPLKN